MIKAFLPSDVFNFASHALIASLNCLNGSISSKSCLVIVTLG